MLMLLLWLAVPARAQVAINETNFPDPNFRAWVQARFNDANNPGYLNEATASKFRYLSMSDMANGENITNLKGIEYFTGLWAIYWNNGQLTSLDVSNCTELETLKCDGNQLTELNVTNNTALTELWCEGNQLTSLDVSNCTELEKLKCSVNQLTELDVTNNTALIWLECYKNQLTELDVTKNTALKTLDCCLNQLTELDVTKNTALTGLECKKNQLTELDVTKNTALKGLGCGGNQLTELDVTNNTALESLSCWTNQLTELDVTNNTKLDWLLIYQNQLTELYVTNNTALENLSCFENKLSELDVTHNTKLTWLACYNNQITTLDLSQNPSITNLSCQGNKLTSLDLSNLSTLSYCNISGQTVAIGPVNMIGDGGKNYFYVSLEESIEGQPSFIDMVHILEGTTSETFVPFDLSRVSWTSGCEVFHGTKQGAPRRAAISDGLRPDVIQGDVLLLDPFYKKFRYQYDTNNASAGKMSVIVSWDPSEIVTAIDDVQTDAAPVSVRYLNAAGMSANEPWQGVNIVVTTMSDGSQTVTKVMK